LVEEVFSHTPDIILKDDYMAESETLMNVIGSDGWSAMHYACYLGHHKIITFFINKGANLN